MSPPKRYTPRTIVSARDHERHHISALRQEAGPEPFSDFSVLLAHTFTTLDDLAQIADLAHEARMSRADPRGLG